MKLVTRIAMALVALAPWLAGAQGPYPNKPVKVVVSTVPGPLDAFARIICEKLATSLKQPFVVENKAGAGGNIAAEYVKGQPADGGGEEVRRHEMARRAVATRGVGERLLPGERDELLHVPHRHRRIHRQHLAIRHGHRDHREILHRIERQALVEAGV